MPHYLETIDGGKYPIGALESPIPCFRCGICCMQLRPRLTNEDLLRLTKQLKVSNDDLLHRCVEKTSSGYLIRQRRNRCVFLINEENRETTSCSIYAFRPEACRNWIPSLSRPECQEGLRKLGKESKIILPSEIYQSEDEIRELYSSVEEVQILTHEHFKIARGSMRHH